MKKLNWIIACILTLSICAAIYSISAQTIRKCESICLAQTDGLKSQIDGLLLKLNNASKQIDNLTQQITSMQAQIKQGKTNRGGERFVSLGEYTITGYCGCRECCGVRDRPGGMVKGAAGVELIEGISVAAPLPLGTRIAIDRHTYIVQDKIAKKIVDKYGGKIIDVYKTDHAKAWNVGNGKTEVWMMEGI